MRTISALEMRAIDRNAQHLGVDAIVLMENAGRQVASEIMRRRSRGSALVMCGPGNNGGDGFVVARHLCNNGWKVAIAYISEPARPEAKRNYEIASKMGGIELRKVTDSSAASTREFREWAEGNDVVVDALLGTGARGEPREPIASLVESTSGGDAMKVAVDLPTGVDSDTGEAASRIFKADLSVTFHCAKHGHRLGRDSVGEVVVADIGIPREAEEIVGPGDLFLVTNRRSAESHKGQNGVLLVIGGSDDYQGAPAISAIAGMRTGIDLVYVLVPESIRDVVAKHTPSLICRAYEGDHLNQDAIELALELAEKSDAVCIGPGLGAEKDTLETGRRLVRELKAKPMVIDADGLKSVKGRIDQLGPSAVITPHAGEFEMLTGTPLPPDLSHRKRALLEWSSKTDFTWVAKGPEDLIARDHNIKVNLTGNECMTVGGTGDCLTGVIGALMARGNDPFRSACAGTFVAGVAGEIATEERGCHLMPTDVAEAVPEAFLRFG